MEVNISLNLQLLGSSGGSSGGGSWGRSSSPIRSAPTRSAPAAPIRPSVVHHHHHQRPQNNFGASQGSRMGMGMGGGGGGLGSMLMTGAALGAGSAIGHEAVRGLMGAVGGGGHSYGGQGQGYAEPMQ